MRANLLIAIRNPWSYIPYMVGTKTIFSFTRLSHDASTLSCCLGFSRTCFSPPEGRVILPQGDLSVIRSITPETRATQEGVVLGSHSST